MFSVGAVPNVGGNGVQGARRQVCNGGRTSNRCVCLRARMCPYLVLACMCPYLCVSANMAFSFSFGLAVSVSLSLYHVS